MRARAPLLLAAGLWLAAFGRDRVDDWVAATVLPPLAPVHSVEVTDREGRLLRAFTVADGRWRLAVSPEAVDTGYVAMLLAYEDQRFREHGGVDLRAVLRAAGQAALSGGVVSGASTLSMQTARLLEEGPTGSVTGKLRQMRVALALERRLGKAEILALYLDRAPFGGNLEGLRSGTRAWFGKDPARLTAAEAALMVALPQSPETRRPDRHPAAALAARDRVLDRAEAAGVIDAATAAAARRAPVPALRQALPALAPHLTRRAVETDPGAERHALTLDAPLQARMERLAAQALSGRDPHMTAAILVADHRSGEILAAVGNAAPRAQAREGWVDMTVALRSPGSTLKPLIYALAFDQGLAHPETLIDDRPVDFGGYAPLNFDGRFRGTLRVREALEQSLNIPAVSLTQALGPAALMAGLRRAGAMPELPSGAPGLAVALGGVGLTLEDLTALYAGLAEGGQAVALRWRQDAPRAAGPQQITSATAAWQVGHVLAGILPPAGAPELGIAYKTGTSYGHRDAWAMGFDGRHVVGVWMGRADGTPVPGAFGADTAAPLLFQVFSRLPGGVVPLPPPPPDALLVANAELPVPLQRFRPRGAPDPAAGGPELAFPPDGAELERMDLLTARVREGTPPFTWLAEGRPVATDVRRRDVALALPPGFVTLSVIDAEGRAARARIRLR